MSTEANLERHHDVVAIGCGPFNLGLAALGSTLPELDLVVLESRPELRWHPGLMFDDAELQLSFLADLVSLVDPRHPLSFLAYLADVDRLYPFYIRERFHPTRREYESYLRWAAARLPSVRFSQHVDAVSWCDQRRAFLVEVRGASGVTRLVSANLVLGIGTEPAVPAPLAALPAQRWLPAAQYLHRLGDVAGARHVTVVGSGQSGAEVALDLLRRNLAGGPAVSWLTRTPSFAPLDYTKLVLEMTTPAYIRYFHALPPATRELLVAQQWQHYKGISTDTLAAIHDVLYHRELSPAELAPVELRCGVTVEGASVTAGGVQLDLLHQDTRRRFAHMTDLVVAATGFKPRPPAFLAPLESLIRRDAAGRPLLGLDHAMELAPGIDGRIFVAHADLHSHGVAAPDLGIGAYRNATILNRVVGREHFRLPRRTAFTTFAPPREARPAAWLAGRGAPDSLAAKEARP